jgi:hypothetical protein
VETKDQQLLHISQVPFSLREELDQFDMETFEVEDLVSLGQDATLAQPVTLCSCSDCVYCCSCISL